MKKITLLTVLSVFVFGGNAFGFEFDEADLTLVDSAPSLEEMEEQARIPAELCPKGLPPLNEDCSSCSGNNPFKNPPLRKEDLGKLELIDEQDVSFNYNIQGKEGSKGDVLNNYHPQRFKTQLLKNSKNGYFACMLFPPQTGPRGIFSYKENNLCVELPFKRGVVPQKGFMKSPENFLLASRSTPAYFDLQRWCSTLGRNYNQRSESGIGTFGMVAPEKGRVYVLKYSFLEMQAFSSRQIIPFHKEGVPDKKGKFQNFSEYYCLSLVPDPSMVEDHGLLSGDFHSCFRIAPMESRQ